MVVCYVNVIVPQVSRSYRNILRGIFYCFLHHMFLVGASDPSTQQQYSRGGKKGKREIFSLCLFEVERFLIFGRVGSLTDGSINLWILKGKNERII